jgi:hypothetical protein
VGVALADTLPLFSWHPSLLVAPSYPRKRTQLFLIFSQLFALALDHALLFSDLAILGGDFLVSRLDLVAGHCSASGAKGATNCCPCTWRTDRRTEDRTCDSTNATTSESTFLSCC